MLEQLEKLKYNHHAGKESAFTQAYQALKEAIQQLEVKKWQSEKPTKS